MIEFPLSAPEPAAGRVDITAHSAQDAPLRELAQKFETAFLSEMLRHTGLGKMPDGFNGGAGEARFSGFLIEAYAKDLTRSGQIGLADRIYQDLASRAAK
ncbi:MAG: rod-binding protein [Pseudomonadota bacterium]